MSGPGVPMPLGPTGLPKVPGMPPAPPIPGAKQVAEAKQKGASVIALVTALGGLLVATIGMIAYFVLRK
jgi:hypothetical protein